MIRHAFSDETDGWTRHGRSSGLTRDRRLVPFLVVVAGTFDAAVLSSALALALDNANIGLTFALVALVFAALNMPGRLNAVVGRPRRGHHMKLARLTLYLGADVFFLLLALGTFRYMAHLPQSQSLLGPIEAWACAAAMLAIAQWTMDRHSAPLWLERAACDRDFAILELELRAKGREIKQLVGLASVLEGERDFYEAREQRWPTAIPGGTASPRARGARAITPRRTPSTTTGRRPSRDARRKREGHGRQARGAGAATVIGAQ